MTNTFYRIDKDGFYIEPVFFDLVEGEELPSNLIATPPTESFHEMKWDGEKWRHGISDEEIEALRNPPHEPSEIDILKEQLADLWEIILFGVIFNESD